MSGRLFACGDLHGHYTELMGLHQQLLDAGMVPARDTLVFLGDENDGGPNTKQVIDQLIAWQRDYPHWVFLKGNHGDLMLDALCWNSRKYGSYDLWWNQGGRATAMSYLPADATDYERAIMQPRDYIPQEHLDWLAKRPLIHITDQYVFIHAGLLPNTTITEHLDSLNDPDMEQAMLWIRDAFIDSEYRWGKRVIFGHTPFKEPLVMPNKIGIDTMRHNTGKLTAVELDPNDQTAEPRFYFQEAVEGPWPT
jgi:serine/threonine protein phosphatase 1